MPLLNDMSNWHKQNDAYYSDIYYTNEDAVEKVIRYVTRTKWNVTQEEKKQLICYGGVGVPIHLPVDELIDSFKAVQKLYGRDNGRKIKHYTYNLNDNEFYKLRYDFRLVDLLARHLSRYFFEQGFQVVYAVHWDTKKHTHIHLVVNTINFMTYKKIDTSGYFLRRVIDSFETIFNEVVQIAVAQQRECPVLFLKEIH